LLSGETTNLSIPKLKDCVESFMSSRQRLKLFLYFIAFNFLVSIGFYLYNDRAYQRKLIKVKKRNRIYIISIKQRMQPMVDKVQAQIGRL